LFAQISARRNAAQFATGSVYTSVALRNYYKLRYKRGEIEIFLRALFAKITRNGFEIFEISLKHPEKVFFVTSRVRVALIHYRARIFPLKEKETNKRREISRGRREDFFPLFFSFFLHTER